MAALIVVALGWLALALLCYFLIVSVWASDRGGASSSSTSSSSSGARTRYLTYYLYLYLQIHI